MVQKGQIEQMKLNHNKNLSFSPCVTLHEYLKGKFSVRIMLLMLYKFTSSCWMLNITDSCLRSHHYSIRNPLNSLRTLMDENWCFWCTVVFMVYATAYPQGWSINNGNNLHQVDWSINPYFISMLSNISSDVATIAFTSG